MPTPYEAVSGLTVFLAWCFLGGIIYFLYLTTLNGRKLSAFSLFLAAICGPVAWAAYSIDKGGEKDADR